MHFFLDTNIYLHALDDKIDAQKTIDSQRVLEYADHGKYIILYNALVFFEFHHHLKRLYRLSPKEIIRHLESFFLKGGRVESKAFSVASSIHVMKNFSLPFSDAIIALNAIQEKIPLLSYDKDFDRVDGLIRLEPKALIRKFS